MKRRAAAATLALAASLAACGEDQNAADDREPAATQLEADAGAGEGFPLRYRGEHQDHLHHLLGRTPGWRTPADPHTDAGEAPSVPVEPRCVRDTHVAAAVQFAWAAESFYRLRDSMAAPMARRMRGELNKADRLCATRAADTAGCRTLRLWSCPPHAAPDRTVTRPPSSSSGTASSARNSL